MTNPQSVSVFLEAMKAVGESFTSEDLNHLQNHDAIFIGIQRLTDKGRESLFLLTLEDDTEDIVCDIPVVSRVCEDKDSLVKEIQYVKDMLIPKIPIAMYFGSPLVKSLLPKFTEFSWLPKDFVDTFEALMRLRFPNEYLTEPESTVKTILDGLSAKDNCIRMDYYYETDEVVMQVIDESTTGDEAIAWVNRERLEDDIANVRGLIKDRKQRLLQ